jgi:nucleotide-binding universal stress UspA family protein
MFNQILCPINFTTFSHHALARAAAVARAYGAAVTSIHVIGGTHGASAVAEDVERMQAQVLKALREASAPSPTGFATVGDPASEIVKLASALRSDLVVMPVHGWTGLKTYACGSVTQQVLCNAPVPVLVVPDSSGAAPSHDVGRFKRIVCGIDFSPASLKALRYATALAAANRASQLVVTHAQCGERCLAVGADQDEGPGVESPTSIWQRRLHAAAHGDVPPGLTIHERLTNGDPAAALLQVADEEHCDLVVIGGHRGNPPGCVMNAVVTRSRCPVLVVRASR